MSSPTTHAAVIEEWERSHFTGLAPAAVLGRYQEAFDVLWRRALITLGDTSLIAIVDRVLFGCRDSYAWLNAVILTENGLDLAAIPVATIDENELRLGLRSVLVEILGLLAKLTAHALTPQLLFELAKVGTSWEGSRSK